MNYRLKWIHKPSGKSWFDGRDFDNFDSANTIARVYMSDEYFGELYRIEVVAVEDGDRNGKYES